MSKIVQKFIPFFVSEGKAGEGPAQDTPFDAETMVIGTLMKMPIGSHGEVKVIYAVVEDEKESPLVLPDSPGKLVKLKPH